MQLQEKEIVWVGSSYDDLLSLPRKVIRDMGHALSGVQLGEFPHNAKPLKGFSGVQEIRVNFDKDTYRAVYAVNLGDRVFILHVFQKKSKKGSETPKQDMDLIRSRLQRARELAKELDQ